jgi:site-specific recombinase XerD
VRGYFTDHLPRLRGLSSHTIHSYRDSVVLLLRFLSARGRRPVVELDLKDLDPPGILAFHSYLERERKNTVATRNARLSTIHALFRFVASRNPEHLDLAQRVLGIPFKRTPQGAIDYLERQDIDLILKAIDRTTAKGVRDYALLATMFNTGARVQESPICVPATSNWLGPSKCDCSAVATNGRGLASVLEGTEPGCAVRRSRVSESARQTGVS